MAGPELTPDPRLSHLETLGVVHEGGESVVLLGPGPGFWAAFTASGEFADGAPDPLDRWSKRVIGALADAWGGEPVFPSDGPPYPPFIAWALACGRIWASPVTLLCHDSQGLWCSFRGAVRLPGHLPRTTSDNPCESCAGQPCRTACPAGALTPAGYDTSACHAWLDTPEGADCMTRGCAVRRACPVGARFGRSDDQSAFHMRAFHST